MSLFNFYNEEKLNGEPAKSFYKWNEHAFFPYSNANFYFSLHTKNSTTKFHLEGNIRTLINRSIQDQNKITRKKCIYIPKMYS